MKRLLLIIPLTFWLWSVVPAGANTVADVALNCDGVTFSWSAFAQRPIDLRVHVTQGDMVTDATVSTNGEPSGSGAVPVDFADGPASATISWTNQKEHTVGPVTADLHCTVTTTTEPSTTTVPPTTAPTTAPPVTTPPEQCGPNTMPCTGTSSTVPLIVGGWVLVVAGALALVGGRRGAQ